MAIRFGRLRIAFLIAEESEVLTRARIWLTTTSSRA